MTNALALLIAALHLLTVVSTTPNLPPSFKETAISIANTAIAAAQDELAKQPSNPIQAADIQTATSSIAQYVNPQPAPSPVPPFGGIINPVPEDLSKITVTPSGTQPKSDALPLGSYAFTISVLDTKGKPIHFAEITLTDNDGQSFVQKANTESSLYSADWKTTFEYIPTSTGAKTLTFSSGIWNKQVQITVE